MEKREKCNIEAEKHKFARNKLNDETKHWANERDKYNSQSRELVETANQHRANRDRLNDEVKKSKSERDVWNKKVNEISEILSKKKKEKMPKKGPTIGMLKKKLRDLEFQQQTSVLSPDKERALIDEMSKLQAEIKGMEKLVEQDAEVKALLDELKESKDKAEQFHKTVGEMAEAAQREHDLMMAIYEQGDAIRKQADKAQEEFIKNKVMADEEHKKHIEFIRQVHDFDKIVSGLRQKQSVSTESDEEKSVRDEAVDIYEKFKKGEKLSTEDLLVLQKSGYL
ncbi:MAG: phosphoserine phosphatase [Candidatus Dadabacteria bacterium]|nr:phosphoserine phosphatase [Candidatus Dadabacteria bacterium]